MKKITEILKIKYPIIQALWQAFRLMNLLRLYLTLSGLGVLAASMGDPNWVRDEIRKTKA